MTSLRRQLLRTLALMLVLVFVTQGFVLYGALACFSFSICISIVVGVMPPPNS